MQSTNPVKNHRVPERSLGVGCASNLGRDTRVTSLSPLALFRKEVLPMSKTDTRSVRTFTLSVVTDNSLGVTVAMVTDPNGRTFEFRHMFPLRVMNAPDGPIPFVEWGRNETSVEDAFKRKIASRAKYAKQDSTTGVASPINFK